MGSLCRTFRPSSPCLPSLLAGPLPCPPASLLDSANVFSAGRCWAGLGRIGRIFHVALDHVPYAGAVRRPTRLAILLPVARTSARGRGTVGWKAWVVAREDGVGQERWWGGVLGWCVRGEGRVAEGEGDLVGFGTERDMIFEGMIMRCMASSY
jgi:hypothetical protein